jgi:hypothetical protein
LNRRLVGRALVGFAVPALLSGCLLVVPMGTSGMMRLVEREQAQAVMPTPNPMLPMVSTIEAPKKVVLAGAGVSPPPSPPPLLPSPQATPFVGDEPQAPAPTATPGVPYGRPSPSPSRYPWMY